ncbi:type V CRISPR-associated protein Cas12a/Cpf1 [bacterium]|nr:type V CRISPR-associated protein Cas12a/Cpf1 [bacterium]
MDKNIFKKFTNQYEFSKTLRFELKPAGKKVEYIDKKTGEVRNITITEKMLEENQVFEKDEKVARNYKKTKKWFDKLHREFIDNTLNDAKISIGLLQEYEQAYFNYKNNKTTNWNVLNKLSKDIRNEVVSQFEKTAELWRDNYVKNITDEKLRKKVKKLKKLELLFKVEVFEFLKKKYPEAVIDKKSIFDSFNKFSTYFTGFHQTRQNFYKDDGTSTAIPTRIVNENLPKFLENKKLFEGKYFKKHDSFFNANERSIFTLEYFQQCLSQEQIEKYNDVIAGLKSKINEKRQKADNKNDFPFFKTLFKQILGEENKKETEQSDFIEITTDDEVFTVLQDFIDENEKQLPKAKKLFEKFIKSQLEPSDDFEIEKIYVAGRFINTISNKYFADWNTIRSIFIEKGKKKFDEFVSLQILKDKLQSVEIKKQDFFDKKYKDIYELEDDYYKIFLKIWKKEFEENIENYKKGLESVYTIIKADKRYTNKKDFRKNDKGKYIKNENGGKIKYEAQKETIKLYADASLSLYQMMKYFSLESGRDRHWNPMGLEEDTNFYNIFGEYYNNVDTWKYFNEFRNYLTKKPYSEDKIKLNFENGNLLGGWPDSPEGNTQYKSFIFKKDNKYFLGITDYTRILDKNRYPKIYRSKNDVYEKMVYKQLDGKTIYGSLYGGQFGTKYSDDKLDLSDKELMNRIGLLLKKRVESFPQLQVIIDKIVKNGYSDPKNIATDISKLNLYSISLVKVDASYLQQGEFEIGNDIKKLYLFEIYNKDFAQKADGKKKLHTLYWEEIFSEKNRENPVFKLNGQAEIFFRKASLKKEKELRTKKDNAHEIIKNKRYTENKVLFHCPITLNFGKEKVSERNKKAHIKNYNINIREHLNSGSGINVIGIDRGEKHLAYYSIVDCNGNILEMDSFNTINGTDYHKVLDKLEKERDAQRKSWQSIGRIKDMKKGYVSQVVKKICDLMIKYDAIVVFEDLNVGFKRGRFAIEKQVYQNLELALAKKLNYFVLKDKKENEQGHHTKAYQLTPKIDNFQDIYKQCGFMFYIPASYTSAICPVCGFRKNIQTPTETKEKNKKFVEQFNISYEENKNRFCFKYKRRSVNNEKIDKKTKKSNGFRLFENMVLRDDFIFYSNVERLQYSRKDRKTHKRYPNDELLKIFENNNINVAKNINEQIKNGNFENKNFYDPLIWQIRLILQLRNAISSEKENRDFIQCPACHFHSEENLKSLDKKYKGKGKLEFNGDANGAYNIARKGGLVIEKISQFKNKYKDLSMMQNQDLIITQEEWDKFTQKQISA